MTNVKSTCIYKTFKITHFSMFFILKLSLIYSLFFFKILPEKNKLKNLIPKSIYLYTTCKFYLKFSIFINFNFFGI